MEGGTGGLRPRKRRRAIARAPSDLARHGLQRALARLEAEHYLGTMRDGRNLKEKDR